MNWLKVGAIVIGGIIVFFVLDSVVHLLLGLLTALAFVAIVAGGGYVAYKIVGGRRRRQVTNRPEERKPGRQLEPRDVEVPPFQQQPQPQPQSRPAHADVEDELARLKREMGS
jgi:hypothetical protein